MKVSYKMNSDLLILQDKGNIGQMSDSNIPLLSLGQMSDSNIPLLSLGQMSDSTTLVYIRSGIQVPQVYHSKSLATLFLASTHSPFLTAVSTEHIRRWGRTVIRKAVSLRLLGLPTRKAAVL